MDFATCDLLCLKLIEPDREANPPAQAKFERAHTSLAAHDTADEIKEIGNKRDRRAS